MLLQLQHWSYTPTPTRLVVLTLAVPPRVPMPTSVTTWFLGLSSIRLQFLVPVQKQNTAQLLVLSPNVVGSANLYKNYTNPLLRLRWPTVIISVQFTCPRTHSSITAPNTSRSAFSLFVKRSLSVTYVYSSSPTSWRKDYWHNSVRISAPVFVFGNLTLRLRGMLAYSYLVYKLSRRYFLPCIEIVIFSFHNRMILFVVIGFHPRPCRLL